MCCSKRLARIKFIAAAAVAMLCRNGDTRTLSPLLSPHALHFPATASLDASMFGSGSRSVVEMFLLRHTCQVPCASNEIYIMYFRMGILFNKARIGTTFPSKIHKKSQVLAELGIHFEWKIDTNFHRRRQVLFSIFINAGI